MLFIVIALLGALARANPPTTQPAIDSVVAVGITVDDLDRSLDFYTRVLDFKKVSETEILGPEYERLFGVFGMRARVARLRLGDETLELTEYLTPRGRQVPRDSRSNDRWFQHIAIVTRDMDAAFMRLRRNKVRFASTGPQTLPAWNPNAGGIKAFYFRDPDDHVLEIIWFPGGKGDPRWHSREASSPLFMGIDHTAIVVDDTERSLQFYRDQLGLRVAGGSENWGDEQEHLNNVLGARLRITSLRAPRGGPGIEFLEYLTPRDGRAYPSDAKTNDLFHWHTIVATRDANLESQLIRDPDGHALLLVNSDSLLQNTDGSGLALRGYDPVSYFDAGPAEGSADLTASWHGATYRFTSLANRDRFRREPGRFVPAFGGWCATGVAEGIKIDINPLNYKLENGKLLLFFKGPQGDALVEWNKHRDEFPALAERNWKSWIDGGASR
jgi:catechol 2,3-dioxygenase-like lactoylglutathione lyase family enzyme